MTQGDRGFFGIGEDDLRMTDDGRAFQPAPPMGTLEASSQQAAERGGGVAHPDERRGLAGTSAADAGGYRPPPPKRAPEQTPEQLMARAQAMLDAQSSGSDAQLGNGPSVGPRDDAGGQLPDWLVQEMRRQGQ